MPSRRTASASCGSTSWPSSTLWAPADLMRTASQVVRARRARPGSSSNDSRGTAAMTLVAGVDSSTQSCKVVIRDAATGALVRSGRAAHPEGTEVDPERWWDALRSAVADAGGLADVAALAVGGQQHGMVALDANGAVVRDALLWNDTRSAAAAADLVAELGHGDLAAGAA